MDNNNKARPDNDQSKRSEPHINRTAAVIFISLFIAILILPSVAWGVLKLIDIANPAIMQQLDFDTGENRKMADFPSRFDPKTITSDIESWYNDNLPFRSVLYSTYDRIDKAIETPYDEVLFPALIKIFHPGNNAGNGGSSDVLDLTITEEREETEQNEESETLPEFEQEESGNSSRKAGSRTNL